MTIVRWIGAIGGLLLVLGGTPVAAQPSAEAFFHEAAQQYVNGNVAAARRTVEQGLEVAPSNPRLLALRKKLRQGNGRRGGRSSQQGQQNQQQGSPSGEAGTQGDRSNASGQKNRSRTKGKTPSDRSNQPPGSPSSSSARANRKTAGQKRMQKDGERRRARLLSRAQAIRLLRALENQEQKLLREVRVRAMEKRTVEKDW